MARTLIDELRPSAAERDLLEFGLSVYMTNRLRSLETTHAAPGLVDLEVVLGAGAVPRLPPAARFLPEPLMARCAAALERAQRRTAARVRHLAALGPPG